MCTIRQEDEEDLEKSWQEGVKETTEGRGVGEGEWNKEQQRRMAFGNRETISFFMKRINNNKILVTNILSTIQLVYVNKRLYH